MSKPAHPRRWAFENLAILWSAVAAVALGVAEYTAIRMGAPLPAAAPVLFNASLSFAGITAGFAATSKSILFAGDKSRWAQILAAHDRRNSFIGYMSTTTNLSLLVVAGALVGLFLKPTARGVPLQLAWLAWRVAGVALLVSVWRVSAVLAEYLREPAPTAPPHPAPPLPAPSTTVTPPQPPAAP